MTQWLFTAPANAPFQFAPTLDGNPYTCQITWNTAGQRWYVTCYTLAGDVVFTLPLIGSPPGGSISITAGYFASTMIYQPSTGLITVSP